jgi:hypothetical protein
VAAAAAMVSIRTAHRLDVGHASTELVAPSCQMAAEPCKALTSAAAGTGSHGAAARGIRCERTPVPLRAATSLATARQRKEPCRAPTSGCGACAAAAEGGPPLGSRSTAQQLQWPALCMHICVAALLHANQPTAQSRSSALRRVPCMVCCQQGAPAPWWNPTAGRLAHTHQGRGSHPVACAWHTSVACRTVRPQARLQRWRAPAAGRTARPPAWPSAAPGPAAKLIGVTPPCSTRPDACPTERSSTASSSTAAAAGLRAAAVSQPKSALPGSAEWLRTAAQFQSCMCCCRTSLCQEPRAQASQRPAPSRSAAARPRRAAAAGCPPPLPAAAAAAGARATPRPRPPHAPAAAAPHPVAAEGGMRAARWVADLRHSCPENCCRAVRVSCASWSQEHW